MVKLMMWSTAHSHEGLRFFVRREKSSKEVVMTEPELQCIRRSDAFTNAATVLMDATEEQGVPECYPEF